MGVRGRGRVLGERSLNGAGYFLAALLRRMAVDPGCVLKICFSLFIDQIICNVWMEHTHHHGPGFTGWDRNL